MPSSGNRKPRRHTKDFVNRVGDKTFEAELEKAKASVAAAEAKAKPVPQAESAHSSKKPLSSQSSAIFASLVVAPCAYLFQSPRFGITLSDKAALLVAVALLSVIVLMQAYRAKVESVRQTDKGRKTATSVLQYYAIFFVNLIFLSLFLTIGFFILPTIGGVIPVPNEITYFLTVAGSALLVYLWQKGKILRSLA